MATIKEIAALAGVSRGTVDRVLNDRGAVNPETAEKIRKIAKEGKMKAVASVTFDEEFVVHDIKIIEGINGLFIAMPSRKMSDGNYRDIAHPLLSETRVRINNAVLNAYENMESEEPDGPAEMEA